VRHTVQASDTHLVLPDIRRTRSLIWICDEDKVRVDD